MITTTPTPLTPENSAPDGVKLIKQLGSTILGAIVFSALVPTWLLTYFGYDISLPLVFSVACGVNGLLAVVAALEGVRPWDESRKHQNEQAGQARKTTGRLARGCLGALLLMLIFGALEIPVGYSHAFLAYVLPSLVWDVVRDAVKKLRRKNDGSKVSPLLDASGNPRAAYRGIGS